MALLLRAPHWRRCLAAVGGAPSRALSTSAARAAGQDSAYRDMQDPSKTHPAYSNVPEGREVPGPEDVGTEREVKWGQNIPASAEQAVEEAKYAGKGLAESVEQAAGVLASKAKDAAAAAARAVGLGSDQPHMGSSGGGTSRGQHPMGAAGKMEHPPQSGSGPEARYDEMSAAEKPNFPEGERSVNKLFPDMKTAAAEQSATSEGQREENEAIRQELRGGAGGRPGSSGGGPGGHSPDEVDASNNPLEDNLHNRGP